jgi:hypothetical protein
MNTILIGLTPIAALVLSQVAAPAESPLLIYGPMGVICGWLILRDEKRAKEGERLREEIGKVAHEMKGLNRNLLYQAAIHGPAGLKEVAAKELERVMAKQ